MNALGLKVVLPKGLSREDVGGRSDACASFFKDFVGEAGQAPWLFKATNVTRDVTAHSMKEERGWINFKMRM
jgi:hypothetical protein